MHNLSTKLYFFIILFLCFQITQGQTQFVKSVDEVEVAYTVSGYSETALIFIHGWSCNKSYWSSQINTFNDKYKVITIDLAGHGESGLERENYTVELFGEDVAAVVNNLELNKVILIGHSMGGSVIIEAAKRLDGRVIGLIGVDTYQSFTDDWTPEQKEGFLHSFNENFVNSTIEFVKSMFPPDADQILLEKISQDMSQAPPRVATSAMRNLFYYNPIPSLKEIDLPIISINCDLYPVNIEENKKHVKSFEVKMMKGVGHFIMLERPEEFNSLLSEAVDKLLSK